MDFNISGNRHKKLDNRSRNLRWCAILLTGLLCACGGGDSSSSSGDDREPAGAVTTIAGSGAQGNADGTGSAARFSNPAGITTDGIKLYVADIGNHRIRQIDIATGEVTTLAGSVAGLLDGIGTAARFFAPRDIATDGVNLYVTSNSHIRKIVIATGEVTTLAGSINGHLDGIGTAARFTLPRGISIDGNNLYIADSGNNRIRQVAIDTAEVTTIAGSTLGYLDGIGSAAQFFEPDGMAIDGTNLYTSSIFNNRIRKIVIATGEVTTFAGDSISGSLDGIGTSAQFLLPQGLAVEGDSLYVVDEGNWRIRKIDTSSAEVTTFAGNVGGYLDEIGTKAQFSEPWGIASDGSYLYVTDSHRIRRIRLP